MKKTLRHLFSIVALAFVAASCCTKPVASPITLSGIDPAAFDTIVNNDTIALYTLTNNVGSEVTVTNYGGRIVSIWVADKAGNFADVVHGFDNIKSYMIEDNNFGGYIGRYGNRIGKGTFTIDDVTVQLPINNMGHCLHGGIDGFHKKICKVVSHNSNSVQLAYTAADGEEGFPGTLATTVTYILGDDNSLAISYQATTDKPTVANLTNHSYFNLSGNGSQTIEDHLLYINADAFTAVDSTLMTYGTLDSVANTPMDFRIPTAIGIGINEYSYDQLRYGRGYDHNWVLNTTDATQLACKVTHPTSGRTLEVYTTEPGVQFYAGNFLDGTLTGKQGVAYPFRSALCLETQHYPDSPNKTNFPSTILRPGETYKSLCIYKFGIEK